MIPPHRPVRSHQSQVAGLEKAIGRGELDGVRDILAAVTPSGGKSLLPVIAAAELIATGMVERVVWVMPRDSLRLQVEKAFADPSWRDALGHRLERETACVIAFGFSVLNRLGFPSASIPAGVPAGISTADADRRRDNACGGARSGPQAHSGRGLAPTIGAF